MSINPLSYRGDHYHQMNIKKLKDVQSCNAVNILAYKVIAICIDNDWPQIVHILFDQTWFKHSRSSCSLGEYLTVFYHYTIYNFFKSFIAHLKATCITAYVCIRILIH